LQKKSS